ncbi:AI-2E family transporter [Gordonia rubripertincta]|uniref:AI-2E family transporter n=1 Tax=Gordonia rubripertincta TaxID=36822 RepID=UPI0015F924EA|nr:AI-2E family transporter [Gordonia rubripertincta]QMU21474.1 AI-2E family transporter [Gordonia rubripertincta]
MSEAEPAGRPNVAPDLASLDRARVHPQVRAAAEWAWRLLLLLVAAYVAAKLFVEFEEVLVPVALAILVAAMLVPAVDALDRRGVPRSLAVLLNILLALGFIAGVMTFVVREFMRGVPQLVEEVSDTVERTKQWLIEGPLDLDPEQVRNAGSDVVNFLQHNQDRVTSGALATATTASEIITGALLTLFLLIFFLYGGAEIWRFSTGLVPAGSRDRVWRAGIAGFGTLVGYVRATIAVAFVDACGIGVGLAILQVPLALPLASLVFLGAFIPIVGALLSGSLAVLVALITQGWIAAVVALAIVVGVMQLESHVLQPFLLGRSVRLHPVAVVLGIAAGLVSAGIIGGLLAVPLIAFLNTAIRHLKGTADADHDTEVHPGGYVAEASEPLWDTADPDATAEAVAEGGAMPHDTTPPKRDPEPGPQDPGTA